MGKHFNILYGTFDNIKRFQRKYLVKAKRIWVIFLSFFLDFLKFLFFQFSAKLQSKAVEEATL